MLILAGGRDARARPHEAEAILDRVRSHGTLSVFEGADHVRMLDADPARYRRLVLDFLDDLAGKRP